MNVSCDFERDFCSWGNSAIANRWKIGSEAGEGAYAINGSASGNGQNFAYISSDSIPPMDSAALESPNTPPVNTNVTFYYRLYGYGAASLSLYARIEDVVSKRYLLWSAVSSKKEWQSATVAICINDYFTVSPSTTISQFIHNLLVRLA